jgi:hypothetical protein
MLSQIGLQPTILFADLAGFAALTEATATDRRPTWRLSSGTRFGTSFCLAKALVSGLRRCLRESAQTA